MHEFPDVPGQVVVPAAEETLSVTDRFFSIAKQNAIAINIPTD
jgi:hypothetical protein